MVLDLLPDVDIESVKSRIAGFDREVAIGAALGAGVVGAGVGITKIVSGIKRRRVVGRKRARKKRRVKRRRVHIHRVKHIHRRRRKKRVHRGVHKHRVKRGLDIIHRGRKKGISLKTIRAAIASPRTPPHLKKGLRKLLRRRSR